MATSTPRGQGVAGEAGWGPVVPGILTLLVTVRAYILAFSVPYVWLWTDGLDGIIRVALLLAHSGALLAVGTANTAADRRRGIMPRLGLYQGSLRCRPDLAVQSAPILGLVAFAGLASLAATTVDWLVPVSVALLLLGGWAWTRAPLGVKYLGSPEVGAPLLMLVVPAAALAVATPASPPLWSVVAGVAFLVALLLATALRDREGDLAADIPTVATRRPATTRTWMWLTAGIGGIAVLSSMYSPLGVADWLGVAGATAFLVAPAARASRVALLTAAHGLIGLYWIFG